MRVELVKVFTFEAAHFLPRLPETHKCRRLHGHSFRIEVSVAGDVDPEMGWLMDYAVITEAFEPLRRRLDHANLNEVAGLENATSENLARHVWLHLRESLPGLVSVTVHETCAARCVFRGEGA
jgi:6-pyruvoyltetrahydropterin/6-carboxytetrahydropterin synthase